MHETKSSRRRKKSCNESMKFYQNTKKRIEDLHKLGFASRVLLWALHNPIFNENMHNPNWKPLLLINSHTLLGVRGVHVCEFCKNIHDIIFTYMQIFTAFATALAVDGNWVETEKCLELDLLMNFIKLREYFRHRSGIIDKHRNINYFNTLRSL